MAEVAIAHAAFYFYARHAVAGVFGIFYNVGRYRYGKAGPTCTRFKFGARVEQRSVTTAAGIQAGFVGLAVLACKGALGAFLARNIKFFFG